MAEYDKNLTCAEFDGEFNGGVCLVWICFKASVLGI